MGRLIILAVLIVYLACAAYFIVSSRRAVPEPRGNLVMPMAIVFLLGSGVLGFLGGSALFAWIAQGLSIDSLPLQGLGGTLGGFAGFGATLLISEYGSRGCDQTRLYALQDALEWLHSRRSSSPEQVEAAIEELWKSTKRPPIEGNGGMSRNDWRAYWCAQNIAQLHARR